MKKHFFAAIFGLLMPVAVLAQVDPAAQQQRELLRNERFDQLRQLDLDTRTRANEAIPLGQRAFID